VRDNRDLQLDAKSMICPRLAELPSSPSGKTGWPWTEESRRLEDTASDGQSRPRISVITPSFNQGRFIEETIRSILLQGYPDLEYFILDGGSMDGSVEIIKKYSSWLSYWVSKPDDGQSDAINRGLRMGTGSFATWINSDDMLCRNALIEQGNRIELHSNAVYVGICSYIDENSKMLSVHQGKVHSLEDLVCVRSVWRSGGYIVQPEVLFPREFALSVGGLNPDNDRTMDYELWGKLFLAGATFHYTDVHVGMFREHENQKTHDMFGQTRSLIDTARKLALRADYLSEVTRHEIIDDLDRYAIEYEKNHWKTSGRLAKVGLPRPLVLWLRHLREFVRKPTRFTAGGEPL